MTAPPVRKRGLVSLSAVLVVVLVSGAARAEVVFRKKTPAPATDSEASPSGGDIGEVGTEGAPAESADKTPSALQADDKDSPEAQAARDQARADAALARQARNAQLAKKKEDGTPIYQKWQFWAIAGGAVVGLALAIWGGTAVAHQINGGDVRACPVGATGGCFGEGR